MRLASHIAALRAGRFITGTSWPCGMRMDYSSDVTGREVPHTGTHNKPKYKPD